MLLDLWCLFEIPPATADGVNDSLLDIHDMTWQNLLCSAVSVLIKGRGSVEVKAQEDTAQGQLS